MLKTMRSQLNWLGAGIAVALLGAMAAPASAQMIIIQGGHPYNQGGSPYIQGGHPYPVSEPSRSASFIYGSPIPTPMRVDPATGLRPKRSTYYSYPYSYPVIRQRVVGSTLVNPILVNPTIRNSTVINPVIVNDSWGGVRVIKRPRVIYRYR